MRRPTGGESMQHDESSLPSSLAEMAALGQLLEEHRPRLLAMLQRRLDPKLAARLSAEEVLTDAFLQARRKWAGFKEQDTQSPYAWLYRIVLDCLIECWRRETRACRDPRRELPWPQESSLQLGLGLVASGTSPSKAAARAELRERMRQTLDLLKQADREVLWMRHYDQLSFPEAAQILGLSESAATLRYVRAVKRLKKLWQDLYPDESGNFP